MKVAKNILPGKIQIALSSFNMLLGFKKNIYLSIQMLNMSKMKKKKNLILTILSLKT